MLNCPKCDARIPDKLVLGRCAEIARKAAPRRGPNYFRKLQAKRKKKTGGTHGGRPRLKKT